jgi:hemerythrin-like domain-containing protein
MASHTATQPKTTTDASRAADAIALRKADQAAVKALFREYNKLFESDGDNDDKNDVAARICQILTVHVTIEDEIFYPALREAFDEQALLDEAEVERATAKVLIGQLEQMKPDDQLYDATVIVLGDCINRHVGKEEGEIFKAAREANVDMEVLGEQMLACQQELLAELGLAGEDRGGAGGHV